MCFRRLPRLPLFINLLGDEQCVCLRLKSAETEGDGASVNLVFERDSDTGGHLEMGSGF